MKRGYTAGDHAGEAERRAETKKRLAPSERDAAVVQQHYKNDVDVNTIVRRFGVTGEMPVGRAQGVYADFAGIEDFEGASARVADAWKRFYALPPEVRAEFDNSPAELIRFVQTAKPGQMAAIFGEPQKEGAPSGATEKPVEGGSATGGGAT